MSDRAAGGSWQFVRTAEAARPPGDCAAWRGVAWRWIVTDTCEITEAGGVMKGFLKYLLLPAVVLGVLANMKDIKRYIRIRNM